MYVCMYVCTIYLSIYLSNCLSLPLPLPLSFPYTANTECFFSPILSGQVRLTFPYNMMTHIIPLYAVTRIMTHVMHERGQLCHTGAIETIMFTLVINHTYTFISCYRVRKKSRNHLSWTKRPPSRTKPMPTM